MYGVPHAHCACEDGIADRPRHRNNTDPVVVSCEEYRPRSFRALICTISRQRSPPSPFGLRRGSLRSLKHGLACRAVARKASEGWWAVKVWHNSAQSITCAPAPMPKAPLKHKGSFGRLPHLRTVRPGRKGEMAMGKKAVAADRCSARRVRARRNFTC
jgi:hypothetical protein